MRSSNILAVGIVLLPVFAASEASAREGARVVGTHVAERPAAGGAWTPLAGGRMHPGWQLTCPEGCTLETPSGRVRLDETTTVRDLATSSVQRDGGQLDAVSESFEIREGGVTAEVVSGKRPVLLQSLGGGQLVVPAGRSGRVISRGGRDAFAAMEGDAELRTPGEAWSTLPAGSVVFARAMQLGQVHALPAAPAWTPDDRSAKPTAIADVHGKALSGATWTSDPNAVAYRFEIASDARFTRPIRSGETQFCSITEKLPVGTYFVRIRAIDVNAIESRASTTRTLRIVGATPGA